MILSEQHNWKQVDCICNNSWIRCNCALARRARDKEMNEETKAIIAGYPDISAEDARLIFIRQKGRDDWKNRSAAFQDLIACPDPIKDVPREKVIDYINFLHVMIKELRAYAQGLEIQYAREVEPEISEKTAADNVKRDAKRSAPKTLEGMLAKSGLTKEALLAAIKTKMEREAAEKKSPS